MPRDPYIREKFTRESSTAPSAVREYFKRYPKEQFLTELETWALPPVANHRIHHEAAAGADRGWRRARRWLIAAGNDGLMIRSRCRAVAGLSPSRMPAITSPSS